MESKLQKIEKMIAALQKEKGVNQRILLKMYVEKRNELMKYKLEKENLTK